MFNFTPLPPYPREELRWGPKAGLDVLEKRDIFASAGNRSKIYRLSSPEPNHCVILKEMNLLSILLTVSMDHIHWNLIVNNCITTNQSVHRDTTMKIANKLDYIDWFIIPSWLYMFRAIFSPIIRSTWLYLQSLVVFTQVAAGSCPEWDTSRQQLGWTLPDAVNTVNCSW